jgi:acyl-coenzyme A thioesterase PaaI-like protein
VTVVHDRDHPHVVAELGLAITQHGDGLRGTAPVVPELLVPGTDVLRASVLATWADLLCGLLVAPVLAPRVPVTLDLALELSATPGRDGTVEGVSRVAKAGRDIVVIAVDFTQDGRPIGCATAAFMGSPDATFTLPPLSAMLSSHPGGGRLTLPFADRTGCERIGTGAAELPRRTDGLNGVGTINGGLLALVAEEAALSAADAGAALSSLSLRYLRPARVGPVVARATLQGPLAQIELRDAGADARLVVAATARLS